MSKTFVVDTYITSRMSYNGCAVTVQAVAMMGAHLMACVTDPTMPNPSNIPGIGTFWVKAADLTRMPS